MSRPDSGSETVVYSCPVLDEAGGNLFVVRLLLSKWRHDGRRIVVVCFVDEVRNVKDV